MNICAFIYGKQKQTTKLQLNEEPDKAGTPVEAEKLKQTRFQQLWKTK